MATKNQPQQVCTFFLAGSCRAGSKCIYKHTTSSTSQSKTSTTAREPNKKVVPIPCKFFQTDSCKAGSSCPYVHDRAYKMTSKVNMVCKYFAEGYCSDGRQCVFVHDRERALAEKSSAQARNRENQGRASRDYHQRQYKREQKVVAEKTTTAVLDFSSLSFEKSPPTEEDIYFYGGVAEEAAFTDSSNDTYTAIAKANVPQEILNKASEEKIEAKSATCKFYQQGLCRYGNSCRNSHEEMTLGDDDTKELRESANLECEICFEVVTGRFGLLTGCTHAFCLDCVRNWRSKSLEQDRRNLRQCPVCRVETYFIIPCNRMVTDPSRKKVIIESYKNECRLIDCRHFNFGKNSCPFGTSCFYRHAISTTAGTNLVLEDKTVRTATDSTGAYDVVPTIQLGNFI